MFYNSLRDGHNVSVVDGIVIYMKYHNTETQSALLCAALWHSFSVLCTVDLTSSIVFCYLSSFCSNTILYSCIDVCLLGYRPAYNPAVAASQMGRMLPVPGDNAAPPPRQAPQSNIVSLTVVLSGVELSCYVVIAVSTVFTV